MRKMIAAFLLLSVPLFVGAAQAGEKQYTCPNMSSAEQLGSCPSDKELMDNYRVNCPPHLERTGQCAPFASFKKNKNKALWAVKMGDEEFLPYISCSLDPEVVKASKSVSLRLGCRTDGRCTMLCGYENDIVLRLRFAGVCKAASEGKIDCKDNPAACSAICADGK